MLVFFPRTYSQISQQLEYFLLSMMSLWKAFLPIWVRCLSQGPHCTLRFCHQLFYNLFSMWAYTAHRIRSLKAPPQCLSEADTAGGILFLPLDPFAAFIIADDSFPEHLLFCYSGNIFPVLFPPLPSQLLPWYCKLKFTSLTLQSH